jgi:hypothetical protein
MQEWIAPVVGLIGVVLGAGISEFRHWRENKEQYRVMTFEKRLKIYQEALSWFYRLNSNLNLYDAFIEKSSERKDNLIKTIDKVDEWWKNNCLLLDERTRQKIVDLLLLLRDHVGFEKSYDKTVHASLWEMRDKIIRGIGVRHLPEISKDKR